MSRRRRGSGIETRAWGTTHDSIVKPPLKPRTMEQVRMYRKPIAKNIAHPFHRNGQPRTV